MRALVLALAATLAPLAQAQTTEPLAGGITLESCLQAALQRVPGKARSAELESRGADRIYEFEIESLADGHTWEVSCNATTGSVIEAERDVPRDDPSFRARARVSASEALQAATAVHPGTPRGVEFEMSPEGEAWYEVEILRPDGTAVEVMVDAVTGQVTGSEASDCEQTHWRIGAD